MHFVASGANMSDKQTQTITAMNTEKGTRYDIEQEAKEREDNDTSAEKSSLQFGLSIAIGVLTIVTVVASFYYGLLH